MERESVVLFLFSLYENIIYILIFPKLIDSFLDDKTKTMLK